MPETSDGSLPGRRPPVWRRRSVLITSSAAVAAAVAAVVILWPGSQPQEYTTTPPPCTLVTAATLARYLPSAKSAPLGPSVPGGCRWLSISGPLGQRELVVTAAVFGSVNISQAGSAPPPTGPQLLSDTIAVARDVLAVLANPGLT